MNFFDPTSITLAAINVSSLICILKMDFSPIYIASGKPGNEEASHPSDPSDILDAISEKHWLTRRERDVMELVYKGYSNPDISSKLYISRNTVKKHVHNVYEKLDVSTRMEMTQLINSQMHPNGSHFIFL